MERNQLRQGMSIDEVRSLLNGWRMSAPVSSILPPDKTHVFYTLDCTPTKGTGGAIRITFDNGKILFWGEPAEPDPAEAS